MTDPDTPPTTEGRRYAAVAIALHWTIALLIVANIVLAWDFTGMREGLGQFRLIQWHKSIGITVLVLSVLRLGWRLTHRPPPYPPQMRPWEKASASAVHWGLYGFMVLMPLSGWLMVSASPRNLPTLLFRTIPWPHIGLIHGLPLDQRKELTVLFENTHEALAWIAYALVALHVAAALKHQFVGRDDVLWRMAPLRALRARPPSQEDR